MPFILFMKPKPKRRFGATTGRAWELFNQRLLD